MAKYATRSVLCHYKLTEGIICGLVKQLTKAEFKKILFKKINFGMINLYNSVKNSFLPSSCLFCHHRLSIDFDELFNDKLRMSSNKCYTKIDTPMFKDGHYIINCQIQSKEGFYKGVIFKVNS